MAISVKQMMEAANAAVPRVTPAQASEMIAKGKCSRRSRSGEKRQGRQRPTRLAWHA